MIFKIAHEDVFLKNERSKSFYKKHQKAVYLRADRIFSILMPIQWIAVIIGVIFVSPYTWRGADSSIHPHLWEAIFLGGLVTILPMFFVFKYPGEKITRNVVAVSQMLMSGMLIHLTGGRIETHFHIFGSLAFLSFYRDWKILIPATIVTAADHFIRGWLYPFSIYGVFGGAEWRWIEHASWVLFEDIVLIVICRQSVSEMKQIAKRATELDASEERYRTVVEQLTEGIFLLDPKSLTVIECNESFRKILGYDSVEEVKNLNAAQFDNVSEAELNQMVQVLQDEKGSLSTERKYRKKDGSTVNVELTGRRISYGSSEIYCVNVRDISAKKAAENEVKRLALVAQKTQNAVIISDPEGKVQWVNEAFSKLTGYQPDEIIGMKPGHLLQGKDTLPETVAAIRKAIDERQPFTGEIYNYKKSGKGYWLSISIMPIYSRHGNLKGFIAIEMDITERKKMEEALRNSQADLEKRVAERTSDLLIANRAMQKEMVDRKRFENELNEVQQFLRKVIDTVPNMIYVKDPEGKYTLVNSSLARMFGVRPNDLIGKTIDKFVQNKGELEQFIADDQHVIKNWEEKTIFEEKFTDSNGDIHWLQTVKRPLFGDSGVEFILGISTDLTERKILESQLRHAQKLESIGQLAAGIAHEINTPTQYVGDNTRFIRDAFADINNVLEKYDELLNAVKKGKLDTELILKVEEEKEISDLEYLTAELPKAIQQSLEGVSRIARIVQSMKDFAHPGSTEMKAVDLNRAIESTITVARNEWKYVADLETELDESLPLVPCFLSEFNQVVLNMVINASHSIGDVVGDGSQGKGKIKITTTKVNDDWAEVRISDTGAGIPAAIQNKVFDPFFTTKDVGKGTGQGLAISHTVVVDKHNGKLSFETEEGKGTTFIIQLPLSSEQNSKSN